MTTKTVSHTPGPWTIDECFCGEHEHSHYEICAPIPAGIDTNGFNYVIADTAARDPHTSAEEAEANARLIAAAPAMLAELKRAHDMLRHYLKCGYLPPMSAEEAELMLNDPDGAIRQAEEGQ